MTAGRKIWIGVYAIAIIAIVLLSRYRGELDGERHRVYVENEAKKTEEEAQRKEVAARLLNDHLASKLDLRQLPNSYRSLVRQIGFPGSCQPTGTVVNTHSCSFEGLLSVNVFDRKDGSLGDDIVSVWLERRGVEKTLGFNEKLVAQYISEKHIRLCGLALGDSPPSAAQRTQSSYTLSCGHWRIDFSTGITVSRSGETTDTGKIEEMVAVSDRYLL